MADAMPPGRGPRHRSLPSYPANVKSQRQDPMALANGVPHRLQGQDGGRLALANRVPLA